MPGLSGQATLAKPELSPSFISEVMADSPSGFWMLDETSGTTAVDRSGFGASGTYAGSPAMSQAGIDGNLCTLFDGTNDVVSIPGSSTQQGRFIPSASRGVTVEAWWKGTAVGSNSEPLAAKGLVCMDDSTTSKHWVSSVDGDGKFRVHTENNYILTGPGPTVNNDVWHQLVFTINTSFDVELFVDGVSQATNTSPDDAGQGSTTAVTIGRHVRGSPGYLAGLITGVAIFTSVLTPTRIAAHYAAGT